MSTPEQYARLARGVQLLSNILDGEGPQSTRMVFDFSPQSLREFAALQGHIATRPNQEHPRDLLQTFLHELQAELVNLTGSEELPPGKLGGGGYTVPVPTTDPLLPTLQLRVAEWLGRAGPLVRDECDAAELTITLHTPQTCRHDDETLVLEARLEEKATTHEVGGALPGIKRH